MGAPSSPFLGLRGVAAIFNGMTFFVMPKIRCHSNYKQAPGQLNRTGKPTFYKRLDAATALRESPTFIGEIV
jgi:hypothetical protein